MTKSRKTILVTGANGQWGQELARLQDDCYVIIGLDRVGLSVTDLVQCRQMLAEHKPFAVIHAGAYTTVDKAESEPDAAYRVKRARNKEFGNRLQRSRCEALLYQHGICV